MATKSETNYAKTILLSANIIFAIIGFLFLVVSAWINNQFHTSKYVTLGIFGLLLLIFAYLGFFSKLKNDDFMVIIFSACLLIIFIAEMSMALSENQKNYKTQFVKKIMSKYSGTTIGTDLNLFLNKDIEAFQKEHKCCGWLNATDWLDLELPIPGSCCSSKQKNATILNCTTLSPYFHHVGCYYKRNIANATNDKSNHRNNMDNDNSTIDSSDDSSYSPTFVLTNLTDVNNNTFRMRPDEPDDTAYMVDMNDMADKPRGSGGFGGGFGGNLRVPGIPSAVISSLLG